MRYAFAILMSLHGLIHLMGFVKAFYLTDINRQVLGISKPIGALWLLTFILFIIASSQFFNSKKWFYIAFIAVLVSQILILLAWKEAKFATILNVVILLLALSAYANHRFDRMIENEIKAISIHNETSNQVFVTENDTQDLPKIIVRWLRNSGVLGKVRASSVQLNQIGVMRIKPDSKWMPFEAIQYFNIENPSFVWSTTVQVMPLLKMKGRDKLTDSKGEMLIKLAGIFPVVNERHNEKINSGTMIRYLSEICWFPSAALDNCLVWETIDDTSAKAIFTYNNRSVSGVFRFTKFGEFISFEAERYYGGDKNAL